MNLLERLFSTPSGFEGDARGFAFNQAGHMALMALLAMYLPLWVPLVGYVVWEVLQWALSDAEPWDCIEDCGFAFAGALAVAEPVVLAPALAFLVAGYARRS